MLLFEALKQDPKSISFREISGGISKTFKILKPFYGVPEKN